MTSADGTSTDYTNGQKFTPSGDITLYARWSTNGKEEYTITFNPNGGTIETESKKFIAEEETTLPTASSLGLSREGYSFLGWAANDSAETLVWKDGSTITPYTNQTMYAIWIENSAYGKTFTITYYLNDGSGANKTVIVSGGIVTLETDTNLGFARSGYSYGGWQKTADGAKTYNKSQKIVCSGNMNLYAHWVEITYTITYHERYTTLLGDTTSETVTATSPTITLKSASQLGWIRQGYIFEGWSTSSSAVYAEYSANESITLEQNLTLYAVWAADETVYIWVRLYHPEISNSSSSSSNIRSYGYISATIDGDWKISTDDDFSENSYTSSPYQKIFAAGKVYYTTSYKLRTTTMKGANETSYNKNGYYEFTNRAYYTINCVTGEITKD